MMILFGNIITTVCRKSEHIEVYVLLYIFFTETIKKLTRTMCDFYKLDIQILINYLRGIISHFTVTVTNMCLFKNTNQEEEYTVDMKN